MEKLKCFSESNGRMTCRSTLRGGIKYYAYACYQTAKCVVFSMYNTKWLHNNWKLLILCKIIWLSCWIRPYSRFLSIIIHFLITAKRDLGVWEAILQVSFSQLWWNHASHFVKREQPCDQRDLMKCNTNILILIFLRGEVEIMSFCTSQSIQFLLPSLKMCFRNTCLSCAIWA